MIAHDSIMYKRNYVDKVIARVDFISPISSIESTLPQQLSQVILASFPISEPKQASTQELKISPGQEVSSQLKSFTEWYFYGPSREKTLVVIAGSIFVIHDKYETYEKIRDEFMGILKVFFSSFKEAQPSRAGLRYINKVHFPEGNPLDWGEYIAPEMLALLDFPKDKTCLSRLFHSLEFAFDECNVRYQFGLHNPDYPARIRQKVFLLDLDAYRQGAIDPTEIEGSFGKYHERIQELFEMSIKDELRKKMDE